VTSPLSETAIGEAVVVWTLGGESVHTSFGANCVAVIDPTGVLLVDPLIAPAHARLVEAALRRRTAAPVRFVVLTHHHPAHALGAAWFAAEGATIVAQRACRERIVAELPGIVAARRQVPDTRALFADADVAPPAVTFDEGMTLHMGEKVIELRHPGWAHTPGDAFLFLPGERVAICGDLLLNGYHFNYEDASIPGVRRALEALRELDADVYIPGIGPAGDRRTVEEQAGYHEIVGEITRGAVTTGRGDEAAAAEIRSRFPGHLLRVCIPTTVTRFFQTA